MSDVASVDIKEQIRRAIDIVDLVGDYVQLRRDGRGYKGLCPWHDDSRPSLQVNPERQSFKCWVCNIGGDIFSFTMKMEGVEFPQAVAMLAERAGVALPRRSGEKSDEKALWYRAAAWAEQEFHNCLLGSSEAEPARRYLAERGICDALIQRFHLGFAPNARNWLLARARGSEFSPQTLETIGLLGRSQSDQLYERFRGRVLFSIRDQQGRPIGIGGRLLPGMEETSPAKYINSPESPLFTKSEHLYGLHLARDAMAASRTALVMEGYTDVIMAHQHGLTEAVAVLGTALGERHVRLLKRFAERIVLVLDGDAAGQRRANEVLEIFLSQGVDVRILTLPDGLDPCEFLLNQGAEAFRALVAEAPDAVEHRVRQARAALGGSRGLHEVHQALEGLLETLGKTPRAGASQLKIDQVFGHLAQEFAVPEESLRKRVASIRRSDRRSTRRPPTTVVGAADQERLVLDSEQSICLEALLQEPRLFPEIRSSRAWTTLLDSPCGSVFACAAALWDSGIEPNFSRLLLEIDAPQMKTLLVEHDERARGKGATAEWSRVLGELFLRLERREAERLGTDQLARLSSDSTAGEQEAELLRTIMDAERNRRGMSVPKDG